MKKVKVLIVDDSTLIRDVLTAILSRDARIEVVGSAVDPHQARQMIKDLNPDVLTLDVEMPKMNGIAFLKNLMRLRPMPVVMISTLTAEGSNVTMQALELGAVDFIEKPKDLARIMAEYGDTIITKVLTAANVSQTKLKAFQDRLVQGDRQPTETDRPKPVISAAAIPARRILAVGGSTGSLEALRYLLEQVQFTGKEAVLVALHLPGKFTQSYAQRLDGLLPLNVVEGEDGMTIKQGHIYIAPGGRHMEMRIKGGEYRIAITDDEPVNLHRPSVDVLFDSVVKCADKRFSGMILTGMGKDGAHGLLRMAQAGMTTYAQNEASSVVWGMPGSAVEIGAVQASNVLDLSGLARQFGQIFSVK